MNIALAALSCDNSTGIGRIVRSLANEFVLAGHRTTVIAQHIESLPPGVRPLPAWKPPLSAAFGKLLFSHQTRAAFSRAGFDITHSFGVGRGAQILSAQSCHRGGMKARARYSRGRIKNRGFGLFDAVSLRDERVLYLQPNAVLVIAVSRLVKNELVLFYDVPESRIRIIPNGIIVPADKLAHEERKKMRSDFGIGERDFLLLFIGNEFDRKGLQTVVESMSIIGKPQLRLLAIGGDERTPYERRARKLGVRGQVRFAGGFAGPEKLYECADAFVLPTYYEPFGMVIVEAMAAGLPVITSAKAGAVEDMQHGVHGLYLHDPLSADELAAQVVSLMDDQALRDRLVHGARQAAGRFAWDRVARETLAVYDEIPTSGQGQ